MKPSAILVLACLALVSGAAQAAAPKSALDGFQFDGVESDGALKTAHWTRQHWLEMYPVQAKEYWNAWDCKGQTCDSKWKANIRAKAALISRPKPADTTSATSASEGQ